MKYIMFNVTLLKHLRKDLVKQRRLSNIQLLRHVAKCLDLQTQVIQGPRVGCKMAERPLQVALHWIEAVQQGI